MKPVSNLPTPKGLHISAFWTSLCILFLCQPFSLPAQRSNAPVLQNLIVLGNLNKLQAEDPLFDRLDEFIKNQEGEVIVLFAGDFIDKEGLELNPTKEELAKLNRLMAVGNDKTQLLFLPGDREWDNGRKEGLKKVKALEEYFEKNGKKRHHFLTEEGCPGPQVLDIGSTLRIVSLNTQWFVHEHKRPEEQDADCDLLTEAELWEELEDIVRADDNRNIVIAAHHPALSYGQYAGYKLVKQHFIPPVIGSFIAGYHQNVGNNKDLANAEMEAFRENIEKMFERFHGLIYASGHEFDIQVNGIEDNYHVNSGSFAKVTPVANGIFNQYRHKKCGLVQLRFFEDGAIDLQVYDGARKGALKIVYQQNLFASPCKSNTKDIPVNEHYLPCRDKLFPEDQSTNGDLPAVGTTAAGAEYKAGFLRRLILGKHYRNSWSVPVHNIPYLNLDTTFGGLIAYAKGGAAQTRSVRFKSADGQVFAFRSVNKNPTQKKDKDLVAGIYGNILQDYTSHHHPYGPMILEELMAVADIPNPEGKLYLLPDHPALGIYREEFKGMLGWLELRPKSKKEGRKPYRNADKVYATTEMNKRLYKDHDHQLAVKPYLTARLLDMWVTDWDRHGKNFSYLGYGDKKEMTFYPFPKDRDKAFTKMDGVWRVLDWPMLDTKTTRFRKSHYGLTNLNHKSRNMDRQHLVIYSKEELLKETAEFQAMMTDEVIERAVRKLPPEVFPISGQETIDILKVRRDRMNDLVSDYYKKLAKYIHIIGSNKQEIFEVRRKENGDVLVAMYKKKKNGEKGKLLKERLCKKSETKEIRLYGLGGKDEFIIDGEVRKSIVVRVIGGKGADQIKDESEVSGLRKFTKIYDYKKKDKLETGTETRIVKIPEAISFEMDGFFADDNFLIFPGVAYNIDDGLIFTVSGRVTKQKFNKPGFGRKYNFGIQASTKGKIDLNLTSKFRHVAGEWDLNVGLHYGFPDYYFPRFFGLGNELVINDSLKQLDYYDNNMKTYDGYVGLSRTFWKNSMFAVEAVAEYHDVNPDSNEELGRSVYDEFPKDIKTTLIGPRLKLDIDFRDNKNFPTKGIQFLASDYTFVNENVGWDVGGRVEAEISSFWTLGANVPFTLGVRGGGSQAYGETPFYYQSFLGQTNRLRGYRRNRFSGEKSAYLNTDLRWHFGTVSTRIVPIHMGLFGFYDVGRTFYDEEESSKWHPAYGGGFYMVPYKEQFNIVITVAHSEEEKALISFGLGFFVK